MEQWHHTIWGIVLLGAAGSIVGFFILKTTSLLLTKFGLRIIGRLSLNLLIPFAENNHFVRMCEQKHRFDLIGINYSIIRRTYTINQIIFMFSFGLSTAFWTSYINNKEPPLIAVILFSLWTIKDFIDVLRWRCAIYGCLPNDMKMFRKEIERLKKKDKYEFVENAIRQNDS